VHLERHAVCIRRYERVVAQRLHIVFKHTIARARFRRAVFVLLGLVPGIALVLVCLGAFLSWLFLKQVFWNALAVEETYQR
jgi:cell division septal protein FtsQ